MICLFSLVTCCTTPQSTSQSPSRLSSRIAKGGIAQSSNPDGATGKPAVGGASATVSTRRQPSSIAQVNGRPIDSRSFVKTLVDSRGLMLLQQLIFLEAVRHEANKRNIEVSESEIDREYDLTLRSASSDPNEANSLTPAQREVLIDKWTKRKGVPRVELAIAMARQALLRKMAHSEVRVSSDDVRAEYDRVFGEKVEVRHLQLPARRTYNRIKSRLDRGDRFEDLVTDYSVNSLTKARGGLLPAFTRDDPTVPRAFANVAFDLSEGDVSPLFESEGSYHVIKLVRRISAESGSMGDSRSRLEKAVLNRHVTERMESLGRELLMTATIRIDESAMRDQYADHRKRGLIDGPPLAN